MQTTDIAQIAAGLSKPQACLILALSGDEYRDWGARGMPGTIATRKKIEWLTERESARHPWMRKLNERGLQVRAFLQETPNASD